MAEIMRLQVADASAKADMLALLDELRADIEAGETMAIVAIPIKTSRRFETRSAGEVGMVELCGYLGRCWLDAQETLKR